MSYVFFSSYFIKETLEDFLVINVQMPISISRNIIEYTPLRNNIIVTNVSMFQNVSLKNHLIVCSGEALYNCDICVFDITLSVSLKKHLNRTIK